MHCRKTAIENKRDVAEEKLFKGVISDEDFARNKDKFKAEIDHVQDQIDELEAQREIDIDVVQEALKLTRNIYKAYKTAPDGLKRQYLGLFWDKFLVQDKQIVKAIPTPLIQALLKDKQVILSYRMQGIVEDVRTIIQRQVEYIYIPDLKTTV